MAKRKKQDKIIAKLRRELQATRQELKMARGEISRFKGEKMEEMVAKKRIKAPIEKEKKRPPKDQEKIWEYSPALIKKDLLKTLSLSTLAIMAVLVLYWIGLSN